MSWCSAQLYACLLTIIFRDSSFKSALCFLGQYASVQHTATFFSTTTILLPPLTRSLPCPTPLLLPPRLLLLPSAAVTTFQRCFGASLTITQVPSWKVPDDFKKGVPEQRHFGATLTIAKVPSGCHTLLPCGVCQAQSLQDFIKKT